MRPVPILILLSLLSLFAAGCQSERWVRERLESPDNTEIFLEHREAEGQTVPGGYEHPFAIGALELARILAGLEYRDSGLFSGDEELPVFGPAELAGLAPALARALGGAGPDARLFFVSYNWGGGLVFSTRRLTCGALFVDGEGLLNVAFSSINEEHYPTDYAEMGLNRHTREPTKIRRAPRPLELAPWLRLKSLPDEEEGVHPLWCRVDIAAALAVLPPAPFPAVPPETGGGEANPLPVSGKTTPPTDAGTAAPGKEARDENARGEALREKLKLLKELRDENLITEEEYNLKKKELLQSF